jgi:hypothetical protein
MALVPLTQRRIDARLGAFRSQEEILYAGSGELVKRLTPGFSGLMADVYWLRTVQYFGGQRVFARDKSFALLEPLIDITVTLDPQFEIAYRYGATFLSEPFPLGAGDPEAGIALLERGFNENRSSWRLLQEAGYFSFFYLKDDERAVRLLTDASRVPGSPEWLTTMIARILAGSGRREIARSMWLEMYRNSEAGAIKNNAWVNLKYLAALDLRDSLQRKVESYKSSVGRYPRSLDELVKTRMLSRVPNDPANVPFEYDRSTGSVSISRKSWLRAAEKRAGV